MQNHCTLDKPALQIGDVYFNPDKDLAEQLNHAVSSKQQEALLNLLPDVLNPLLLRLEAQIPGASDDESVAWKETELGKIANDLAGVLNSVEIVAPSVRTWPNS